MVIDNKPVINNKAIQCGLFKVGQLLDEDNQFKSFDMITNEFGRVINFVQYYGLLQLVPFYWKCILRIGGNEGQEVVVSFEKNCNSKNPLTDVYIELVNRPVVVYEPLLKWEELLHTEMSLDEFHKLFSNMYAITNSAKLRSFQYNILHHTLVLNEYVFKRRRRNTNLCSFCVVHAETALHFFWDFHPRIFGTLDPINTTHSI